MRKGMIFLLGILILAFLLIAPLSGVMADEKKQKSDTAKEEKQRVYTNEDLEKYAEPEEAQKEGSGEESTYESVEETIKKIKAPEDMQKWKEARLKAAEDKVKAAEMELDYLKKKEASIHNPFLPKPELTEKDQQAEASMDNVKRLERTQKQIEEAQENLKIAEEELDQLKQELHDAGI